MVVDARRDRGHQRLLARGFATSDQTAACADSEAVDGLHTVVLSDGERRAGRAEMGGSCRRDGSDNVIEVYPAGALRCWGIQADGYKRPDGAAARDRIVATITEAIGLVVSVSDRQDLVATDDALDALVAALVARAFALGRAVGPTDV